MWFPIHYAHQTIIDKSGDRGGWEFKMMYRR